MAVATVATLAAGLFAGAALYITLVEHPARLACGTAIAVTEFRPSYRRATWLQAPLALIAAAAGVVCWAGGGGMGWLVGALGMGAIVPFTLVVILPTNEALLGPTLDVESADALVLLRRWGALHAIRTAVSLAAFALDVALLAA